MLMEEKKGEKRMKHVVEGIVVDVLPIKIRQKKKTDNLTFCQKFSLDVYGTGSIFKDLTLYDTLLLRTLPQVGDKVRLVIELHENIHHKIEYRCLGYKRLD